MRFWKFLLSVISVWLIVCSTALKAQTWRVIHQPTGQSFRAVHFFNKTSAVAAGNYRLWRSGDGGASWQEQALPLSGNPQEFYDLLFIDANRGWACGRNKDSAILSTANGGITWEAVPLPNDGNGTPYWHGIEFADSLHGWAAGFSISTGMQTGLLAATTDGGKSWQLKSQNQFPYLFDVSFADTLRGWACGFGGTIIHTEDGGNTWLRQNTTTSADLYRLQFTDSLRGYAVGCSGTVLKTIDGGKNWQNTLTGSDEYFHDLYFVNPETGWVVGSTGTILATRDGGISWETQQGTAYHFLKDVYFLSDSVGWVAGKDGAIFHTEDGGHSWQSIGPGNSWAIRKIQMFDAYSGVCSGDGEMIMTTSDGGWEWQLNYSKHHHPRGFMWMEDGVIESFENLQMINAQTGWAATTYGGLFRTNDGGRSWKEIAEKISNYYFTGPDSGWAAGINADAQLLYKSVDGGETWNRVLDEGAPVKTIYFYDGSRGWCTTANQSIFTTIDGGQNWKQHTIGTTLTKLYFISETIGWALSDDSIYQTLDGGLSWQIQLEAWPSRFKDLVICDAQNCYAVAGNTVLATHDGGNHWEIEYTADASDVFNSITISGNGSLLVAGSRGKIWKRTEANEISQKREGSGSGEKHLICYPNPFNPIVKIKYVLARSGAVKINIVDVLGRVVWKNTLPDQNKGVQEFIWNGQSNTGLPVTSGVYFVQLLAEGQWFTEKIVLVK